MPVVEVSYKRLAALSGATPEDIQNMLPFLGLDIESEDGDTVRVEYSPNRPDYSTEWGMALGLQGLLDIQTGLYDIRIRESDLRLYADDSVLPVRPAVTSIAARNGTLDDHTIKQIISMQEDLHSGLGRRRRKLAIGFHDMDTLQFPLRYTAVPPDTRFVPLGGTESMSARRILTDTEQGAAYGHLLADGPVPVIRDAQDTIASMPPIINSNATVVTGATKSLVVDITGHNRWDVENALAVTALTLQAAGYDLEKVHVSGAGNRTPPLENTDRYVDHDMINRTLGLRMSQEEAARCIRRSRLGAQIREGQIRCTVPPYRFDIMGEMDIVEEAALGYGIFNMDPEPPPIKSPGRPDSQASHMACLDKIMTGMGYTQALNSSLIGRKASGMCNSDDSIAVANPKSQNHVILRQNLLPGLMMCLSANVHEPYPHRLYETGTVFFKDGNGTIREKMRLCMVMAHRSASFSEAKSALQSLLHALGQERIRTPPHDTLPFRAGHSAEIYSKDVNIGMIGEITDEVCAAFRIRKDITVVAFEIDV